ncbi:hypothetical protein BDK51DRAFT_33366 [Blyttiomyces helicus]|uniref:SWIM-type domain-containing protein n=1 Tax=Blyttiomyces helicus TaxID=388810 RepID=A0A4P9WEK1_9FUNG|nr:hypothetical protein BDK51DRAFT_33366 [Blyttiomyces helicus]|eukprot:RKO89698.1 hypothetical protein BDK51DRAFT_33366 [Blyttiomyces helicus]
MRQGPAPGTSPSTGTALIGHNTLTAPACVDIAAAAAPATLRPLLVIGTSSVVPGSGAQQDVKAEATYSLSKRNFALVSCTENTVVVRIPSQVAPGHAYLCSLFTTRMPTCDCPHFRLGANGDPGGCVDPCKHIRAAVIWIGKLVTNGPMVVEDEVDMDENEGSDIDEADLLNRRGRSRGLRRSCRCCTGSRRRAASMHKMSQVRILRISRNLGSLNSDVDPDAEVVIPEGEVLADFVVGGREQDHQVKGLQGPMQKRTGREVVKIPVERPKEARKDSYDAYAG